MLRYHRSLNHKLYRLRIGSIQRSALETLREIKVFGFRGEYVGGVICLVNSVNERDLSLLNSVAIFG
eukprot:maker-scaffold_107-snap-gene-0.18-mRNA-1 protein AED:0.49 eAED:0.62 QI:0/0/0/1/0/0/2/0/66